MRRLLLISVLALFIGCGESNNSTNNGESNNGAANNGGSDDAGGAPDLTDPNNGEPNPQCEMLGEEFKAAVRSLEPRTCFDDIDCKIVERSGPCDCAIAVRNTVDLSSFDTIRASLDQNECRNPFFCGGDECSDYLNLNTSGDIFARCQGECQIVQVMSV